MNIKGQYKTKQQEELLTYLESVQGSHVTVNDICRHFKECGKTIGTTTIYRQLEHMVDEGVVNKYIIDGNSPACFEYVGRETLCHQPVCFHCKCEKCGRLIHLHCSELVHVQQHILEEHGFDLKTQRTVLYGICDQCKEDGGLK